VYRYTLAQRDSFDETANRYTLLLSLLHIILLLLLLLLLFKGGGVDEKILTRIG
jgi:hypothetical protein